MCNDYMDEAFKARRDGNGIALGDHVMIKTRDHNYAVFNGTYQERSSSSQSYKPLDLFS